MTEPNHASPSGITEEFASGSENTLRRLTLRLFGWIFVPPYFPADLTWFLLALIATNIAAELLSEPAAYWIDPSLSLRATFLGTPLSWGYITIGIYIVYMILAGLAVSLLRAKAAFLLWMTLFAYHLLDLTSSFRCGAVYFPFENSLNCVQVHTIAILATGVLWGLAVFCAARLGLISWLIHLKDTGTPIWTRSLRTISVAWIALAAVAVAIPPLNPVKTGWRGVQTAHAPSARTEAALAYDTERRMALLFGGSSAWTERTGWNSTDETWAWDGNDWNQLHPAHSPSPRFAPGMAFDEKRGVIVLFGGSGQDAAYQTTFSGETWEWNGEDWRNVSPAHSPPARQSPNMFYDPTRGTVVIYGGYYLDPTTQEKVFYDDAWEWNGELWSPLRFEAARRTSSAAIVFDEARQFPLLMDGEGLWAWRDGFWLQPNFSISPPGRWGSDLVYDPKRAEVILFGGFKDDTVFDDTWVYNGQAWSKVITKVQPPRRNGHNLFYDQTRGTILLFGGLDGPTLYNDMWELVQQ